MTPQKSKNLKKLQVCRHFFLGSKKSECCHMLFYIVQHVYFKIKKVLGGQLNILAEKEQRKWRFSVKLRRFSQHCIFGPL